MNTPLKAAFEEARTQDNIEIILPILLNSKLFILGRKESFQKFTFITKPSPIQNRLCVTASENKDVFSDLKFDLIELSGKKLIELLPNDYEIIICYPDGGDYISKEQLDWYKTLIQNS